MCNLMTETGQSQQYVIDDRRSGMSGQPLGGVIATQWATCSTTAATPSDPKCLPPRPRPGRSGAPQVGVVAFCPFRPVRRLG